MAIEVAMARIREIPCKFQKITHNYLIFLFYYHFLLHFIIISRHTELIFDYIQIFSTRSGSLWKVPAIEADTAWNRGIACKVLNLPTKLYFSCFIFYVFTFSIKRCIKGEIFIYVREKMCWPLRQLHHETGEYPAIKNTNQTLCVVIFLLY